MKTQEQLNSDDSGSLNDSVVEELRSNVKKLIQDKKFVEKIVSKAIHETGIERSTVLRRAYDGNSEAEFLVEKMIGEFLSEGKINR